MVAFIMVYSIITAASTACALMLMFTVIIARMTGTINKKSDHISNIFWMSCADFYFSTTCFLQTITEAQQSISCFLIAFCNVFFNVATASWYFVITFELFMLVCGKNLPRWMEKRYIYHAYVWILSFVASAIALPSYTKTPLGICWIKENSIYQLVLLIPLTIYLSFAITFLCLVLYIGQFVACTGERRNLLCGATVLVGVFLIIWLPAWIWQFLNVFFSIDPPIWFQYMTCILASISGISNFVVWVCFFKIGREQLQEETFETLSTNSTLLGKNDSPNNTTGILDRKKRKIKPTNSKVTSSLLSSEAYTIPKVRDK